MFYAFHVSLMPCCWYVSSMAEMHLHVCWAIPPRAPMLMGNKRAITDNFQKRTESTLARTQLVISHNYINIRKIHFANPLIPEILKTWNVPKGLSIRFDLLNIIEI